MGGVQNSRHGNSGGLGGYISGQKNVNTGVEGVLTRNSFCGGGMDIFWNYTIYIFTIYSHSGILIFFTG